LKALARGYTLWKGALLVAILLLALAVRESNLPVCLRLAHQLQSVDETFRKMAQSTTKARKIVAALRQQRGVRVWENLLAACARTWAVPRAAFFPAAEPSHNSGKAPVQEAGACSSFISSV
jgi:hypothetical protein